MGYSACTLADVMSCGNSKLTVLQVWQTLYLAGFIGFARLREWPWTHSVFTVLHCITMLMKQHSYAFYNGHCRLQGSHTRYRTDSLLVSEVYKRRSKLEAKLRHLEDSDVFSPETPSSNTAAIQSASSFLDTSDLNKLNRRRKSNHDDSRDNEDLDEDIINVTSALEQETPLEIAQIRSLKRLMKWEIDRLSKELRGKCTVTDNHYPRNLNIKDFYGYIPLPTVVYELEYPR